MADEQTLTVGQLREFLADMGPERDDDPVVLTVRCAVVEDGFHDPLVLTDVSWISDGYGAHLLLDETDCGGTDNHPDWAGA